MATNRRFKPLLGKKICGYGRPTIFYFQGVRFKAVPRHYSDAKQYTNSLYTVPERPDKQGTVENWGGSDWDAALLVDEPRDFDETLYIMELANLQLAELEAYDRLLDDALERSYRDLGERPLRPRGHTMRELREIRIDMARFNDELSNITKFFGDWHLARIYEKISSRFHLSDWHRTIDGKLKTLDDLYQILKHDQNNRFMLWLEIAIVLLFVIDLVILMLGLK